jgi:hypothetical protein
MGMDPVTIALIAGTALSATATIAGGQAQKQQYEDQAKQAELQAQAQITERTRALNEALANQNAMTGASGRTLESITSVIQGDKKKFEQDTTLIKAGASAQASAYKAAGQSAQTTSLLNAGGTVASGAYQYSKIGAPTTTKSGG